MTACGLQSSQTHYIMQRHHFPTRRVKLDTCVYIFVSVCMCACMWVGFTYHLALYSRHQLQLTLSTPWWTRIHTSQKRLKSVYSVYNSCWLTGAMMSTHVPWLLKVANLSSQSLAATVTLQGGKKCSCYHNLLRIKYCWAIVTTDTAVQKGLVCFQRNIQLCWKFYFSSVELHIALKFLTME